MDYRLMICTLLYIHGSHYKIGMHVTIYMVCSKYIAGLPFIFKSFSDRFQYNPYVLVITDGYVHICDIFIMYGNTYSW